MRQEIANYLKAGYSGIFVKSFEEARVQSEIMAALKTMSTSYHLHVWTCTKGIITIEEGKAVPVDGTEDPIEALNQFDKMEGPEEGHVLLMQDFHLYVADPNPLIIRRLKESLTLGKGNSRCIIILGCQLKLVPELEKEFTVIEFKLPDKEQLRSVLDNVAASAGIELNGNTNAILDAASGLTCKESEDAFSLSYVERKDILPEVVARIKADTIKKNGLLEIVEAKVTLDDIGGLELLKADLFSKRNLFTKEAKDYGLPSPRPLLCVGQPGTGKSLTATATASVFNLPLLRLEAGRLFGSLVGESERNWRTAFATAKAISPCVVHVDEIDGLFSGGESSGKTDGGTTMRVIKAILQDLQFNSDGLFFVFTANDIDGLPDPLIDRCDVWNVELPNAVEREAIWQIHIAKRKRNPKLFLLGELAAASDGYSGRQIEQAWLAAMTAAFNDRAREPLDSDCYAVLERMVPTSVTMKEAIERRRKRLHNKSQPASKPDAIKAPTVFRKLA